MNMLEPLKQLKKACLSCTQCYIGQVKTNQVDPHVFSNMTTSSFFILGQNPGKNECLAEEPFMGSAGKNFFDEVAKYGLQRSDFYITNAVKCFTQKNRKPFKEELAACRRFFYQELEILRPKLIITLGAFSFNALQPKVLYKDHLGTLQEIMLNEQRYLLFPVYHPSPMNLCVKERREQFEYDINTMADIITQIKKGKLDEKQTTTK